jgi:hypothetical protein
MTSTIKAAQLARLGHLRNIIARSINYEKAERLRKQAEAEYIQDYWAQHHAKPGHSDPKPKGQ